MTDENIKQQEETKTAQDVAHSEQRRVMFRAWDTEDQEMIYEEGDLAIDRVKKIMAYKSNRTIFIFQQFTGLQDKNGKDIYEGDIVHLKSKDLDSVIRWDNDHAMFEIPVRNGESLYCSKTVIYLEDIEVIGNIFENPEFIKDVESGT